MDFRPYKTTTYEEDYPRLALKEYEKTVNLYILEFIDGKPYTERFIDSFGKSAVGKSCIRIRKLDDKKRQAIQEIVEFMKRRYEINKG